MTPHDNRYGDLVLILTMLAWLVPVFFVLRSARRARAVRDAATGPAAGSVGVSDDGKAGFQWGRRPTGVLLGCLVAGIALAALLNAAWDRASRDGPEDGKASQLANFRSARDGLCSAATQAHNGELTDVRDTFFHLHQTLHGLAADAESVDRSAAARLLEAKAVVETGLQRVSTSTAADFDALAIVTGHALAAVGGTDPGPCPT